MTMEEIKTLAEIVQEAQKKGPVPTAIVAPYDETTLNAVSEGIANGLITPELFGDEARLLDLLDGANIYRTAVKISNCDGNPVQPAINSIRC